MSDNPFLNGDLQKIANDARDRVKREWEEKIVAGRRKIEEAGVKVGDLVTVSWKVDDAYGGGVKSHMGPVARLDDWIEVSPSNRSPGHLRLPLASLHHVRIERGQNEMSKTDNPFMMLDAAEPAPEFKNMTNPFMRGD